MSHGPEAKTRTVTIKWMLDHGEGQAEIGYAEVLRVPCLREGFVFQDGIVTFNVTDVVHYASDEDERRAGVFVTLKRREL